MDAIDRFAEEAARFETWARDSELTGVPAAREALLRISSLYVAALALPSAASADLDQVDDDQPERVSTEECHALRAPKLLPIDFYNDVLDPLVIPAGEPGIGSLVDDVQDTYRDVVTGLRAYRAGQRDEALWEWSFNFWTHWGDDHGPSAIRALHAWLRENGAPTN